MPNMGACGDMSDHCPRYIATTNGSEDELKKVADILKAKDVPEVFTMIEKRLNELSERQGGLVLTIPYVCIDCRRQ